MTSKQRGLFGEKIAVVYLKNNGYQIIETNFVSKISFGPQKAEIDIIAKKNGIFIFVEVKLLSFIKGGYGVFLPENKVNSAKIRKIIKAAQFWLLKNKIPLDSKWQIDVVAIEIDRNSKKAKIRHIRNIQS